MNILREMDEEGESEDEDEDEDEERRIKQNIQGLPVVRAEPPVLYLPSPRST